MGPSWAGPENIRSSNILSTSATSMVTRNLKTLGIPLARDFDLGSSIPRTPRRSSECRSGWTGTPVVRTPRSRAWAPPPAPPALPATGSRLPSRRGRSRSACVVNGRLRHTVEGAGRHAPSGLHGRMASVIACGDVADGRSGRAAAKLAYGASETRRAEGNPSRRSDQRLVVAKSHRRRRWRWRR